MQTKSLWYIISGVASLLLIIGVNLFSQPADAQSPSVSSVVNLASGQESLAPGTLAAIFGTNLDFQQPSSVPISVILSGRPVAVLTRSPQELTVQLPVQAQPGLAMLQLALQGFFSSGFPVQLQSFAPGIFTSTGSLGLISHLNGSSVTPSNPAQPGEALYLLAVGLGPTAPPISTGRSLPRRRQPLLSLHRP
jgi:uncharacterized protein (TIGR03437 family)